MPPKTIAPWSLQAIMWLIEYYRQRSHLYNTESPFYHFEYFRRRAYEEIAALLQFTRQGTTQMEVFYKMSSLKSEFIIENNKVINSMKNCSGLNEIYKPTLWCYENLMFLQEHLCQKQGVETLLPENLSNNNDMCFVLKENQIEKQNICFSVQEMNLSSNENKVLSSKSSSDDETTYTTEKRSTGPQWLEEVLPSPKKKKICVDSTITKSEEAHSSVTDVSTTPHVLPSNPVAGASQSMARFITSSLDSLKNPLLKIEITKKIINILIDAQISNTD